MKIQEVIDKLNCIHLEIENLSYAKGFMRNEVLEDLEICISELTKAKEKAEKTKILLKALDIQSDKQRKLDKSGNDCEYEALLENIANKDK